MTDNELATLLMTMAGFNQAEIARVLENNRQTGYLTQTRVQQIAQSAFRKTLLVSGIDRKVDLMGMRHQRRKHSGGCDACP